MAAAPLPSLALQSETDTASIDARKITAAWVERLNHAIYQHDWDELKSLYVSESVWRDILAFDWDWTTKDGPEAIAQYVAASRHGFGKVTISSSGGLAPQLVSMGGSWIQSGLAFENAFGTGRGIVRLINTGKDEWKAWTIFTCLEELKSAAHEPGHTPQILIVGAGQSGLSLAAHIKALGLSYRQIDSHSRIGDSWRTRYDILESHTPSYGDHYSFLKYPSDWPRFAPRDRMANWQEHYAKTLELKVDLNTRIAHTTFSPSTKSHEVQLEGPNGDETIHVRHVVLATGLFGSPIRPALNGEEIFRGEAYHTSEHKSASTVKDLESKRVVIVGSGTSAHDVAQDFVQQGAASVTMVQRGPILSMSRQAIEAVVCAPYSIPGLSIDEADLISNSFPVSIMRSLGPGMSQAMSSMDKDMLDGLENAGVSLLRGGENGLSFVDYAFFKGGHYYIDQGACAMIIDGRIKIRRDEKGVESFNQNGVVLSNGDSIPADIIVFATGFAWSKQVVQNVLGPEAAAKTGDFGQVDLESERIGWWRPTGVPGFWYMTGNFAWARFMSKLVALQIKAVEDGLNDSYYDETMEKERVMYQHKTL